MQRIQVHVFARFRDVLGTDVVEVNLPAPSTVSELRAAVVSRHAAISGLLARSQVAVNNEFAPNDAFVHTDDEIALIPPVSGG
jgi:molybdopterin converting factor subunit 1